MAGHRCSNDDVEFFGFQHVDTNQSAQHAHKLEQDGIVYCGYHSTKDRSKSKKPQQLEEPQLEGRPLLQGVTVVNLVSDDEDECGSGAGPSTLCTTAKGTSRSQPNFRPSSLSTLTKRSEFTIPGTSKRRKKDQQRKQQLRAQTAQVNPYKRRRATATTPFTSTSTGPKEIIVLSDSEDEMPAPKKICMRQRSTTQPMAAEPEHVQRRSPSPATSDRELWLDNDFSETISAPNEDPVNDPYDSDHDYATISDALHLDNNSNWISLPLSNPLWQDEDTTSKLVNMVVSRNGLRLEETLKHQVQCQMRPSQHSLVVDDEGYGGQPLLWTMLCAPCPHHRDVFKPLRNLHPAYTLTPAPGGINRVSQRDGIIAIASAASGGDEDSSELSSVDPYNREGTLTIWYNGKHHILHAHERILAETRSPLSPAMKHYVVQDVRFNPVFPSRIVSSANDRTVRIWDCEGVRQGSPPKLFHTEHYTCTMGKLLFQPEEALLAMGAHDGSVHLLRDGSESTRVKAHLRLSSKDTDEIGDFAWGRGSLSGKLFASSMAKEEKEFNGTHKVFDAMTERPVCTMEILEAGDSIAVDEAGSRVAIVTRTSQRGHSLYLFDGRRLCPRPTCKLEMDRFQQCVTTMKFSPDGIYLAIARDDNTTDVYDSRFLTRGKLHAFTHEPGNVLAYTNDVYGVVEAEWVEGSRSGLGLLTGGCDGCVRLWDVRLADNDPSNGLPIAECEHDLGHFSLGDPCRGEFPLVTGEMSGKVTIFDRTGR